MISGVINSQNFPFSRTLALISLSRMTIFRILASFPIQLFCVFHPVDILFYLSCCHIFYFCRGERWRTIIPFLKGLRRDNENLRFDELVISIAPYLCHYYNLFFSLIPSTTLLQYFYLLFPLLLSSLCLFHLLSISTPSMVIRIPILVLKQVSTFITKAKQNSG